jgi:hypothetical protein
MNNVQQAIRDAAEKGGYRYRWWKVKDLEHTKGTTGCNCALYQSTSTTLISGKHSVRLGTGRMQMPGVGVGWHRFIDYLAEEKESFFAAL